jgi:hypothetical protein
MIKCLEKCPPDLPVNISVAMGAAILGVTEDGGSEVYDIDEVYSDAGIVLIEVSL